MQPSHLHTCKFQMLHFSVLFKFSGATYIYIHTQKQNHWIQKKILNLYNASTKHKEDRLNGLSGY